jgi:predicted pyridoxine 5'-phosphate oxidase superfamily flavin-nucleotide-binding protein
MSKPTNFGDLAFTPAVKAVQERLGTRRSYARLEGRAVRTEIGPDEAEFIAARDSFTWRPSARMAGRTCSIAAGRKGFLRVLGATTLGFADFRGNGQYVSTGNVLSTHHACLLPDGLSEPDADEDLDRGRDLRRSGNDRARH